MLNTNSDAVVVCIVGLTSNVVANRKNKNNETCYCNDSPSLEEPSPDNVYLE
jgi:hypothetical protein